MLFLVLLFVFFAFSLLFFCLIHCTTTLHSMCRRYTFFWSMAVFFPFCLSLFIVLCACERELLLNHLRFLRSYSLNVVVYNFSVYCFMLLLPFVVVIVVFLAFTFFVVARQSQKKERITLCLVFLRWILPFRLVNRFFAFLLRKWTICMRLNPFQLQNFNKSIFRDAFHRNRILFGDLCKSKSVCVS